MTRGATTPAAGWWHDDPRREADPGPDCLPCARRGGYTRHDATWTDGRRDSGPDYSGTPVCDTCGHLIIPAAGGYVDAVAWSDLIGAARADKARRVVAYGRESLDVAACALGLVPHPARTGCSLGVVGILRAEQAEARSDLLDGWSWSR